MLDLSLFLLQLFSFFTLCPVGGHVTNQLHWGFLSFIVVCRYSDFANTPGWVLLCRYLSYKPAKSLTFKPLKTNQGHKCAARRCNDPS